MKRFSATLIINEMHIEAMIRYHLISVRITIIRQLRDNESGCIKRKLFCTTCGNVNLYRLCEKQYEGFLNNSK